MTTGIRSFDYSVDILRLLQWQDNDATKTQAVLSNIQDIIAEYHTNFWENWYNDVFNLKTANEFGLAVWCVILGLPVLLSNNYPGPFFEFDREENFDNAPFNPEASSIVLAPEDLRILLQIRAYKLMSPGFINDVNRVLNAIFSAYGEYAVTAWDSSTLAMPVAMQWVYLKNYDMSYNLFEALIYYDILPRPTGVRLVYEFNQGSIFALDRSPNFDQGIFF